MKKNGDGYGTGDNRREEIKERGKRRMKETKVKCGR